MKIDYNRLANKTKYFVYSAVSDTLRWTIKYMNLAQKWAEKKKYSKANKLW